MKKTLLAMTFFLLIIALAVLADSPTPQLEADIYLCSEDVPLTQNGDITYGDSCGLCTGSTNCEIDCTTASAISDNIDVGGYNITFTGSDTITVTANVTNWEWLTTDQCLVIVDGGNLIT